MREREREEKNQRKTRGNKKNTRLNIGSKRNWVWACDKKRERSAHDDRCRCVKNTFHQVAQKVLTLNEGIKTHRLSILTLACCLILSRPELEPETKMFLSHSQRREAALGHFSAETQRLRELWPEGTSSIRGWKLLPEVCLDQPLLPPHCHSEVLCIVWSLITIQRCQPFWNAPKSPCEYSEQQKKSSCIHCRESRFFTSSLCG